MWLSYENFLLQLLLLRLLMDFQMCVNAMLGVGLAQDWGKVWLPEYLSQERLWGNQVELEWLPPQGPPGPFRDPGQGPWWKEEQRTECGEHRWVLGENCLR